jgi:hypothetical protein
LQLIINFSSVQLHRYTPFQKNFDEQFRQNNIDSIHVVIIQIVEDFASDPFLALKIGQLIINSNIPAMKKSFIALFVALTSVITVAAQDTTSVNQGAGSTQEPDQEYSVKEEIAASEFPALVTEQLQSDDYSGWTIGAAYRKEREGKILYAVELKNGDQRKIVKFDAQGNLVKEKVRDKQ